MKLHNIIVLVACIPALALVVPSAPSHAGSRDAAIAAGIIGAVGTAIILHGMSKPAQAGPSPKRARTKRSTNQETAQEPANKKDPFAASAAPAGYATPVSDTK